MTPVHADDRDRDNNLNVLRLVAALAVMVSHAWPLVHGAGVAEPWQLATGHTLGTVAVMVFFGLSGFLLAGSWARRPDAVRFARRRAARLLPGLWVMLALSVLVLGPAVGTLPASDYLADPGTWAFLLRNALLFPVTPDLPGVFADNPYPAAAGSIWTLHYEALCYGGLLLAAMAGALTRRGSLIAVACLAAFATAGGGLHPRLDTLGALALPFAMGAAAWCWRERLPLSLGALAVVALAAMAARNTPLWPVLFAAAIVYAALIGGFHPCRPARAWNRFGDYSYGIYLYSFPLQGLVQWAFAPPTPGAHLLLVTGPVAICAVLSWHLVEKPWLAGGMLPARRGAAPVP